ncbi:cytosolic phospholipase A2 gamma-like isoform X1 [Aquarana catesbeiana]|uniref:cytosolic phospholipase A2 gamma-like isoform X1 n=1 Tax=Aquarana catesbeiana TaxID=8400 RepID=UPI003CC9EE15
MSTPTKCPDITCCSSSQSEGEKLSVQARKRIIAKNLLSQGMHSAENFDPPVIAVLGSGGGLRAMNAFLGTLSKLSELKLLDVVTYVSGTSGSTWCMASLYNNEKWSDFSCMEEMESQIYDRLQSTWNWDKSWEKLEKAFLEEVFSLTDLWAYVVVYWMTNEIHERNLSNHKVVCENGVNPYPVYSAIEKEEGTWFEFTPHMCGFPAYKCFVKTEFLGSKFEAGRLLKKQPEKDLSYLNGLWGSALSSDNLIREITERFWGSAPSNNYLFHDFIKKIFHELMSNKPIGTSEEPNPILEQKTKFARGQTCSCRGCKKIERLLSHDLTGRTEEYKKKFWKDFAKDLEDTKEITPEAEKDTTSLMSGIYKIIAKMLKGIAFRLMHFFTPKGTCNTATVIKNIAVCLAEWKWGTTNNFLYKWKSNIPLSSKKHISLVDAGLDINIAFPLMLPPHRNTDLILSFDFSEGDPFETLKKTAEQFPFPKITIEDKDVKIPSKSCYIFEGDGDGIPDVMYFPLFNNQTSEGKVDEMREKYATIHISYDESQVKELLEVSKNNVEKNYTQIREKIKQCVQRCNLRRAGEAAAYGVMNTGGAMEEKSKDN